MENDILFMTLGYIFSRFAFALVIGYMVYRVLRGNSNQMPTPAQPRLAYDRSEARRHSR